MDQATGAQRSEWLRLALENLRSARQHAPESSRQALDEQIATLERTK
jgi:hypothetical protein